MLLHLHATLPVRGMGHPSCSDLIRPKPEISYCPDSSFFYSATSAQFHLDQAQQSCTHAGGGLSISREADVYPNDGTRHDKSCKQDVEEIEAYRASFGFSADEIVMTQNYVELSEPLDEYFMMSPFADSKTGIEQYSITEIDDR